MLEVGEGLWGRIFVLVVVGVRIYISVIAFGILYKDILWTENMEGKKQRAILIDDYGKTPYVN